jgi:glycosyltransferase involved in cell wall biosynthesis
VSGSPVLLPRGEIVADTRPGKGRSLVPREEREGGESPAVPGGPIGDLAPERLRVLCVTPWYPTAENPTQGVFVRELVRAAQQYADVEVLHLAGPDREAKTRLWHLETETNPELTQEIPTYRVRYRQFRFPGISYVLSLLAVVSAARRIRSRNFRPEIIHAHVYSSGDSALLLGRLFGARVVISEHSTIFPRKGLTKRAARAARRVFRRADAVLPVSDHLMRSIQSLGLRGPFRVVPNVVDTSLFRVAEVSRAPRASSSKHILFVGLLDAKHKKGVPFLLDALAQVATRRRDWHLDMVGDGPARDDYQRRAVELGISQNVTFHGELPKRAVAEKYRQAAFLVLPSLWETFSVVCAEALCAGVPVLSTRCGGPEEFVTPECGILVPAGDSGALCAGIMEMLDGLERFDPRFLSTYGSRRFAPDVVGKQLDDIYRECLS